MILTEKSITIICLGAFSAVVVIYALYVRSKTSNKPEPYDSKKSEVNTSENRNINNVPGSLKDFDEYETRTGQRFPPLNSRRGMDEQYQYGNPGWPMRNRHPVLNYQMARNNEIGGSTPASVGDILAPPDVAGPILPLYGRGSFAYNSKMIRPNAPVPGYGEDTLGRYGSFGGSRSLPGPSVSDPRGMGVPVPNGSLKFYNERYNKDQFRMNRPSNFDVGSYTTDPGNSFPAGSSLPFQNTPSMATVNPITGSGDFYRPYGPNSAIDTAPFFGSVNAYSPFPEITSPWEKAGILTSVSKLNGEKQGSNILNLFRRAIAPLQDLWEYQVQDKNGFVIKLHERYIEDGDVVRHVIGKEELGPWKAHIFVQNKFVWV